MGQSTDAILCFGVCVASETVEEFDEGDDDSDEAQEKAEKANPLGYMVFMGNSETIDGCEIKLVQHQSASCPEYLVAVKSSVLRAWRGNPKPVTSLETQATWETAVRAFCEKHNIKCEDGLSNPQWWLASDWS